VLTESLLVLADLWVKRTIVLVLGDLGRSPRMLNHAQSLAVHGWEVDLIGYAGAALPADIRACTGIRVHVLADTTPPTAARSAARIPYAVRAGARGARVAWRLARLLVQLKRPDLILVQNPPGIPTLPLAWVAARVRSAALVVDWHNLTSAMLALRLGAGHGLVAFAAAVERAIGRRADCNLFVSQTMADHLRERWGLTGVVFRDRPGRAFGPLDATSRATTRAGILARVGAAGDEREWLIVVSPTSWTADEDFDLLLDAARHMDALVQPPSPTRSPRRRILVVASGRGALRERFERQLAALQPRAVTISTIWMEPDEYPSLVAAADVGLCLHRSASGLDLPMKVMDFFGAGVPVCALDYGPCLAEAVRDGDNGLTFTDAAQLARLLVELAGAEPGRLDRLRAGAATSGAMAWDTGWAQEVLPVLRVRRRAL
jgi:beta-1,4-mannosyltransferase